jgi:glutamate formiminotransferase/formiminotetrahydrofolate cyclodeaminase
MGAALGAMAGWMTFGKRKFEDKDAAMRRLIPPLHEAMKALLPMVDADTKAFTDYMSALSLPRNTPEQEATRDAAMQAGLRKAVEVPLATMRVADAAWEAMLGMAEHSNLASRSDLEVGARCLETGIWGAHRNVSINLGQVHDAAFRQAVTAEADALGTRATVKAAEVLAVVGRR